MLESINKPLLSIVIPTKNRQYTCLHAIESALLLAQNDIEIIVQDCSDTDVLKKQIIDKFGNNNVIKYEHVDTQPSMTDNWNRAFERAVGLFRCGIGDDDAVLPNIYKVAEWARKNNVDAIGHNRKYLYYWPDFAVWPDYTSKLLIQNPEINENVKILERNELDSLLIKQATIPDMNYMKMPMVYHCLLSGVIIDTIIQKTGKFLDGTSLDVYSAFVLSLLVNKFCVFDTPFTLPGACGASNTNKDAAKKDNGHFLDFGKITVDKRIPDFYNLTFSIAESTQKAFSNMNDFSYSKLLDLPNLYADFLSKSFNIRMIKKLRQLMRDNEFGIKDNMRFVGLFLIKIGNAAKFKCIISVKNVLFKFDFIKTLVTNRRDYTLYEHENILQAVAYIQKKFL